MPFEKGHKLAKGGKRPGAGRPSKAELIRRQAEYAGFSRAKAVVQRIIDKNAEKIGETYAALAAGTVVKRDGEAIKLKVDPATTRDAIGKILPPEPIQPPVVPIYINVNFRMRAGKDITPAPKEQIDDGRIKINIDRAFRPDTPAIDVTPEKEAEKE